MANDSDIKTCGARGSGGMVCSTLSLQYTRRFYLPGTLCGVSWLFVAVVHEPTIRPMFKQYPDGIDMPGECGAVKWSVPLRIGLDIYIRPRSNQYLADYGMTLHGGGVQGSEVVVPSSTWVGLDWRP